MKSLHLLSGVTLLALSLTVPARSAPLRKSTVKTSLRPTSNRSWVALSATTDQSRYTVGQPIQVRLTATNIFSRTAILRFSSGQRFDFSIYRIGQRQPTYTWSAARMFPQMVGSLRLEPGQRQGYVETIGDEMSGLKAGRYRLLARLTNSPRNIVAPPITFEVINPGLSITARTDKTSYKIGQPVRITVEVANRATGINRQTINSGSAYDVFISDETGNHVWNYTANLRFIRVLGEVIWQKGETKTYTAKWNGVPLPDNSTTPNLEPGRYRVQAVLQSTPQLYAAPVYIGIVR